jgi:glutamate/tyrosine decarboxylase-like PLP-dependent enzyme
MATAREVPSRYAKARASSSSHHLLHTQVRNFDTDRFARRRRNIMTTGAGPESSRRAGINLLSSYFLGPKAQNAKLWEEMLGRVYDDYVHWRRNYFPEDESFIGRNGQREAPQLEWLDQLSSDLDQVLDALKADYPFYSPRYIAHMTSDQTLPSVLGLFAGILYNPNNVTDEAAPVTVGLEHEVASSLATMLGFTDRSDESDEGPWGHLTSGGTIATLEALWVARQAQFVPLVVADLCESKAARKKVVARLGAREHSLSREAEKVIRSGLWGDFLDDRLGGAKCSMAERLALGPDAQLSLLRDLRRHLCSQMPEQRDTSNAVARELTDFILEAVRSSPYNPARAGYASALAAVNEASGTRLRRGVVFASEAAHYCLPKACNVLGYGSDGLRLIRLDGEFHMDIGALERELVKLGSDEYVAAVVAVLGTTEEGAVDPVDRVLTLTDSGSSRPFWVHVDAAWGGYVASVFDREEGGELVRVPGLDGQKSEGGKLTVRGGAGVNRRTWAKDEDCLDGDLEKTVSWGGPDGAQDHVLRAFGAVRHCDSVVVDPHKLGYTPYASGALLLRDGQTKLLTTQTASYIGAGEGGATDPLVTAKAAAETSIGGYALEGSKAGATATAAWLAHKSIPLEDDAHGRIIDHTLLSAQKLAYFLRLNDKFSNAVERAHGENLDQSLPGPEPESYRVGFHLVAKPDTNVVTFVARPLRQAKSGEWKAVRWPLPNLNALNRAIHARMGVPRRPDQAEAVPLAGAAPPYGHPFFVSKTNIRSEKQPDGTYSFESVDGLLEELLSGAPPVKQAYNGSQDGLIALRCTVMSPYYELAEADGHDYIREFVTTLHRVGLEVVKRFERLASYVLMEVEAGAAKKVARAIQARSGSVRRAVVVKGGKSGSPAKVLLEVRAPLDREEALGDEIRRLGSDYAVAGVKHAETFVRTEARINGEPAIDVEPKVFVFLSVKVGSTLAVFNHALGVPIPKGGVEARIVTGRYDIAVSVSGMSKAEAKRVVDEITRHGDVRDLEVLWAP